MVDCVVGTGSLCSDFCVFGGCGEGGVLGGALCLMSLEVEVEDALEGVEVFLFLFFSFSLFLFFSFSLFLFLIIFLFVFFF